MKAALRCVGLRAAFMLSMGRSTRFSRVVSGPMDHSSARCSRYPKMVGVAIVGRPVARSRDDGRTLEVTRLCTDGTRNVCSFLYGRAAKAAFALGYSRIGTYIRADEAGASLYAANWRLVGETKGRSWDCPSRPRQDRTDIINRSLFEATP